MAFWKKSEDPWDWEPKKQPIPRETGSEPGDGASGLLDELRDDFQDWNENRKAAKARRETPPEPIPCPWCGQPMEPGYLIGGRDAVRLVRQRPGTLRILDPEEALYIRGDGTFLCDYKIAWTCGNCRKLVLDLPEPPPSAWDTPPRTDTENTREEEN